MTHDPRSRTDHSAQIRSMRTDSQDTAALAAADLLECHDATGISLENFGKVGTFVNEQLAVHGFLPFQPNGV